MVGKAGRPLTPKQALFIREYLIDLNATQAAIRAGYSARTAESYGLQLLRKTTVSEAIQEAMAKRAEKTEISSERLIQELMCPALIDIKDLFEDDGSLKRIKDMPEAARRAISGIEVTELFDGAEGDQKQAIGLVKKIRLVPKVPSIELLGKHLGMFPSKVDGTIKHSGSIGDGFENLANLTDDELQTLVSIKRKLVTPSKS